MADEFSLSVDNDWKRQAQEEKRKLAEEQAKKAAEAAAAAAAPSITAPPPPIAPAGGASAGAAAPSAKGGARRGGQRELPEASFTTLVSSLMTQALYYLGDMDPRGGGGGGPVNLDMAKHQIDTVSLLEEKTKGNLDEDEQKSLDLALYELRSRFVTVASQYIL